MVGVAGWDVIVCGSLHLDIVVDAPRLPRLDETAVGSSWKKVCGGKGGNQTVQAARAGARAAMIGRVGRDDFGDMLRPLVARPQRASELALVAGRLDVIVGERDLLTHRACARSLEVEAGARVHRIPDGGHLPLIEEPVVAAELIAGLLASSLSR